MLVSYMTFFNADVKIYHEIIFKLRQEKGDGKICLNETARF